MTKPQAYNIDSKGRISTVTANAPTLPIMTMNPYGANQQASYHNALMQAAVTSQHMTAPGIGSILQNAAKPKRTFENSSVFTITDTWKNIYKIIAWAAEQSKGEFTLNYDLQTEDCDVSGICHFASRDLDSFTEMSIHFKDQNDATNFKLWWA